MKRVLSIEYTGKLIPRRERKKFSLAGCYSEEEVDGVHLHNKQPSHLAKSNDHC